MASSLPPPCVWRGCRVEMRRAEAHREPEVLHFCFDEPGEARLFEKSEHTDAQIRERFLWLHERLVADEGIDCMTRHQLLAAVIVLDQFSRNLFRDTPRAYAADPIARRLARRAIAQGLDVGMTAQERMFPYLPLHN